MNIFYITHKKIYHINASEDDSVNPIRIKEMYSLSHPYITLSCNTRVIHILQYRVYTSFVRIRIPVDLQNIIIDAMIVIEAIS